MTPPAKRRVRGGYSREETDQVISVCLTVAVTLGALMDDLCVVGGLVPSLLIDQRIGPDPVTGDTHPGTNDLDVGLAVGLLNDEQYAEISHRLVRRVIPVCGPATFVVLKSLALADRGEPKDAYDLVYVLRRWPEGISDIADRLALHANKHPGDVNDALTKLANDFTE